MVGVHLPELRKRPNREPVATVAVQQVPPMWVKATSPPPTNADAIKREYVTGRIELDELEARVWAALEAGTLDNRAAFRGFGPPPAYPPLPTQTETR